MEKVLLFFPLTCDCRNLPDKSSRGTLDNEAADSPGQNGGGLGGARKKGIWWKSEAAGPGLEGDSGPPLLVEDCKHSRSLGGGSPQPQQRAPDREGKGNRRDSASFSRLLPPSHSQDCLCPLARGEESCKGPDPHPTAQKRLAAAPGRKRQALREVNQGCSISEVLRCMDFKPQNSPCRLGDSGT